MRFFSVIAVIAIAVPALAQENPPKDGEKKADATETTSREAREEAIFKDIPTGETFTGLRVPHMSPGGKLIMLFDTRTATRIDERYIDMEELKIQMNNDDGSTFHVAMPRALFDLDTRILDSKTGVTITREDFTITGDAAEFDTRKRFGRVIGNVKMIILNTENIE